MAPRKTAVCLLAFLLAGQSRADWGDARDATVDAHALVGGLVATGVSEAARAAVALAKENLKNAKDMLTLANASRGLSAGTIAALTAQVTSATTALAAAEAALAVSVVAAGSYMAGTLISQAAGGTISSVWEYFSGLPPPRPIDPTQRPIFVPPNDQELRALTASLLAAANVTLSPADFNAAGPAGNVALRFLQEGAGLTLAALRGGAAAYGGHRGEAVAAATFLDGLLRQYRTTVHEMANVLDTAAIISPAADISQARAAFEDVVARALVECSANCAQIATLLAQAVSAFKAAEQASGQIAERELVGGTSPIFPLVAAADFQAFLARVQLLGAAGLPETERNLLQVLLGASGIRFDGPTYADRIAAWDALGDDSFEAIALFGDPLLGTTTIADQLRTYATTLSCGSVADCPFLHINVFESPLLAIPEPSTVALCGVGLILIVAIRRRRVAAPVLA